MKLSELIKEIDTVSIKGDIDKDISAICYDSRKTTKGCIYVCKGVFNDGHKYAEDAYEKGARVFVIEKDLSIYHNDATYIMTKDTKSALSLLSRRFYNFPERNMNLIAVTGTKGKTTSTYMIKKILDCTGNKCGLIGTVYNIISDDINEATRTTPEAPDIQKYLSSMLKLGQTNATLEISSHALDLNRVGGMNFDISIFTNLSQDHLDYHKDMEDYYKAKRKLFTQTKNAIINIDDKYGKMLYHDANLNCKKFSLSIKDEKSWIFAKDIKQSLKGTSFKLVLEGRESCKIKISAYGEYNVYNALGAIAACYIFGIELKEMRYALLNLNVPGRQEKYENNKDYGVFIDYAHSPASLESILNTFNEFKKGDLICVFGAGGDRDRSKRPIMGEISGKFADYSIITTDNPRTENPKDIIDEIENGIEKVTDQYKIIVNRTEAIKYALKIAKKNDIIILAGKGHETYQEIDGIKHHYDEREILDRIYTGDI